MERIVTVESIISHAPCYKNSSGGYDVARIRGIVGDGIPLVDGLRLALDGQFPPEDAIWYATRDGVLDSDIMDRWLEIVVTRAVKKYALGSCIDAWARKWLSGEDLTKESAWAALVAADDVSDLAAAWAAAAEAYSDWEEAAALDAAWEAAAAAEAWAAAAERKQQVADLIAILEEFKNWNLKNA